MMCDEKIRIVRDDYGIFVYWGQTIGDVTTFFTLGQQEHYNERTKNAVKIIFLEVKSECKIWMMRISCGVYTNEGDSEKRL